MNELSKIWTLQSGAYTRTVKPEHFFVKYQAFGISQTMIEELTNLKAVKLRFIYKGRENQITYLTTLEQFRKSTKTYMNEEQDLQRFVSVKDMEIEAEKDFGEFVCENCELLLRNGMKSINKKTWCILCMGED